MYKRRGMGLTGLFSLYHLLNIYISIWLIALEAIITDITFLFWPCYTQITIGPILSPFLRMTATMPWLGFITQMSITKPARCCGQLFVLLDLLVSTALNRPSEWWHSHALLSSSTRGMSRPGTADWWRYIKLAQGQFQKTLGASGPVF